MTAPSSPPQELSDHDFGRLLAFRDGLRRFLRGRLGHRSAQVVDDLVFER